MQYVKAISHFHVMFTEDISLLGETEHIQNVDRHAQWAILNVYKAFKTHCKRDFDVTLLWPGRIGR